MSRKNVILFIVAGTIAIALIAGGFAFKYYASFHKVTINIQKSDLAVTVYKQRDGVDEQDASSGIKQSSLKTTGTISLQQGNYFVLPEGKKYDPTAISFKVSDADTSVKVSPDFSEEYLAALLKQELPSIQAVITAKYSIATTNFLLNSGKLYADGTWYGTTLVQHAQVGNNGDVYRTVLHKVNGIWEFAATPELVLGAPSHKDIPVSILSDLNGLSGY